MTATGIRAWLLQLAVFSGAVLFAIFLRAMVFETLYVPSESMLPTLLVGDHIVVDKLTFGSRLPFTSWRVGAGGAPERGQVVVFELARIDGENACPVDRCPDHPVEEFVKRVVGLPGDVVEVRAGRVSLNGTAVRSEAEPDPLVDGAGRLLTVRRETLGAASYRILDDPEDPGVEQVRITVPDHRYFLLGDNRDGSNDSRRFGTVHRDHIVGPVKRIYWSWNNTQPWSALLDPRVWWRLLSTGTRWDRTGMRVE